MAVYRGANVVYNADGHLVPAVTTKHYDTNGAVVDDTAANAVYADLLILGWSESKLIQVTKDASAGALGVSITSGQWAVIA